MEERLWRDSRETRQDTLCNSRAFGLAAQLIQTCKLSFGPTLTKGRYWPEPAAHQLERAVQNGRARECFGSHVVRDRRERIFNMQGCLQALSTPSSDYSGSPPVPGSRRPPSGSKTILRHLHLFFMRINLLLSTSTQKYGHVCSNLAPSTIRHPIQQTQMLRHIDARRSS